jgi:hypothetical protein
MGWSSGSSLMSDIIFRMQRSVPNHGQRLRVYCDIIQAFVNYDCDTLCECLGEDTAYDHAYENMFPSDE